MNNIHWILFKYETRIRYILKFQARVFHLSMHILSRSHEIGFWDQRRIKKYVADLLQNNAKKKNRFTLKAQLWRHSADRSV